MSFDGIEFGLQSGEYEFLPSHLLIRYRKLLGGFLDFAIRVFFTFAVTAGKAPGVEAGCVLLGLLRFSRDCSASD